MDSSILNDIKQMLGINQPEYTVFDTDIIICINGAIGALNEFGIGVDEFYLTGPEQTWNDLVGVKRYGFQMIKEYIYLKTKVVFDPPTSSVVLESYKTFIYDLECRMKLIYEVNTDSEGNPSGDCDCCKPLTEDQMQNLINDLGGDQP